VRNKALLAGLIAIAMITNVAGQPTEDYTRSIQYGEEVVTNGELVGVSNTNDINEIFYATNNSVVTTTSSASQYQRGIVPLNNKEALYLSNVNQLYYSDDYDFTNDQLISDYTNQDFRTHESDNGTFYYTIFNENTGELLFYNEDGNQVKTVTGIGEYTRVDYNPDAEIVFAYEPVNQGLKVFDVSGSTTELYNHGQLFGNSPTASTQGTFSNGNYYVGQDGTAGNITVFDASTGEKTGQFQINYSYGTIDNDAGVKALKYVDGTLYASLYSNTYDSSSLVAYDIQSDQITWDSRDLGLTKAESYVSIHDTPSRLIWTTESSLTVFRKPNPPPRVNSSYEPLNPVYNDSVSVNASVEDSNYYYTNITVNNNGIQYTDIFTGTDINVEDAFNADKYGYWTINVTAYDTFGATNSSVSSFTVSNTAPNVTSLDTEPSPTTEHDNITLSADVTDDKKVDYVEMRVQNVTNWVNATNTGFNTWKVQDIITDAEYRNYTYEARAYDEYGLTDSQSFSEQTIFVNDPPVILSAYTYPNQIEIDDSIDLYVDAEDPDTQIDNVTAIIYYGGDTLVKSSSLKYDQKSDLYEAENAFTVLQNGTYEVKYTATDTGGLSDTSTSEFTVGPEENDTVIIGDSTDSDKPKGFLGTLINSIWSADSSTFMLLLMIGLIAYAVLFEY